MLAFTFSFDDVVISNFTAGAGNDTWPLRIFAGIRFGLRPDLNATATMMLGVTLLGLGAAYLAMRRSAAAQGGPVALPVAGEVAPSPSGSSSVPDARRRTGLVYDERCLAHRNPPGGVAFGTLPSWATVEAFERPERLSLTRDVLEGSGALAHVEAVPAREATRGGAVPRPHRRPRAAGARGRGGRRARLPRPGRLDGPRHARGGAGGRGRGARRGGRRAGRARLDGAVALVRPPGHHAERDAPMGFCLFNNVAVAARWAQREHGVERVAIVDWDVHHGNGTEEIFYGDGSCCACRSTRTASIPPHTGGLEARGEGPGEGANVNVPLPAGTGDHGYAHAFDHVVAPVVRAFRPQLLLIGAGQDAAATDPLGRMSLTVPGFRALADRAVALAEEVCGGRLVVVLEGGYSLLHLPLANLAIVEALAGLPASFAVDPVGVDVPLALREVERAAVEAAVLAHGPVAPMIHDAHGWWIADAGSPAVLPPLEGDQTRRRGGRRRRLHGPVDGLARARGGARRPRRGAGGRPLRPRPERPQRRLRHRHGALPAHAARALRRRGRRGRGSDARGGDRASDRGLVRGRGRRRVVPARRRARRLHRARPGRRGRRRGRRRRGARARRRRRRGRACDSPVVRGGVFVRAAATVHPARLAFGLRERLLARGARVHEGSRARAMRAAPGGVAVRDRRRRARARAGGGRRRQRGERHAARRCATG